MNEVQAQSIATVRVYVYQSKAIRRIRSPLPRSKRERGGQGVAGRGRKMGTGEQTYCVDEARVHRVLARRTVQSACAFVLTIMETFSTVTAVC
jgi:hypothetical protein